MTSDESYLRPEARARHRIDEMLVAAGWVVQAYKQIALGAAKGVAVREFPMAPGHGGADYLLFIDRVPAGAIEAKPEGTTLTGVEPQSLKYTTGLPEAMDAWGTRSRSATTPPAWRRRSRTPSILSWRAAGWRTHGDGMTSSAGTAPQPSGGLADAPRSPWTPQR